MMERGGRNLESLGGRKKVIRKDAEKGRKGLQNHYTYIEYTYKKDTTVKFKSTIKERVGQVKIGVAEGS